MKRFLALATSTIITVASSVPPIAVGNNNITLESYDNLDPQSSVMITTLDFENDTRTDEIIDAEVNEKRRRDEILHRRVKPRLEEDVLPRTSPPPTPPPAPPSNPPPDIIMQDAQIDRSTAPDDSEVAPKKYRLASGLRQVIHVSQIGEKILDTPVQLPIREILAVSSDVSNYLHDQTRKRRASID